ncbi:MAG: hypothetical protein KDI61_00555 [Alphaproteobacteria bacterium]|nr:hypothetical protein [Alphaproteobacteria bacterium]
MYNWKFCGVEAFCSESNNIVARFEVLNEKTGETLVGVKTFMEIQNDIADQLCARAGHKESMPMGTSIEYDPGELEVHKVAFDALKDAVSHEPDKFSLEAHPDWRYGGDKLYAIYIESKIREKLISINDFPFQFVDEFSVKNGRPQSLFAEKSERPGL